MILVQAQDDAGILVAEMVDQAVVEAAIARAGIEADVANAELPQHLRGDVAAPSHAAVGLSFHFIETHALCSPSSELMLTWPRQAGGRRRRYPPSRLSPNPAPWLAARRRRSARRPTRLIWRLRSETPDRPPWR